MKPMKNEVSYIYDAKELANKTIDTIDKIKKYIEVNNYQIKGDFNLITKESLFSSPLKKGIDVCSQNRKKKLNQYIIGLEKKMSLRYINSFTSFIMRDILKIEDRIKVTISEKETKIQDSRKKWKEARSVAEKLLAEYKIEKGDYYKNKM